MPHRLTSRLFLLLLPTAVALLLSGCADIPRDQDRSDRAAVRGGAETRTASREERMASVQKALQWLGDHQTNEGYWDADQFMRHDKLRGSAASDGAGNPLNDVGVTGLALLAFLGNGNTTLQGQYRDSVRRGIAWLRSVQKPDGLFGEEVGNNTIYNHGIATTAVAEAYYFADRTPFLRDELTRALTVIENARNPYAAWRYALEPNGENDTIVTGWMVTALRAAEAGGIEVDRGCYQGALAWFGTMTDSETGRTGYTTGTPQASRPMGLATSHPASNSEGPTAVALIARMLITGESPGRSESDMLRRPLMHRQADLLRLNPPTWSGSGGSTDFYYWMWGSFALGRYGGEHWDDWRAAGDRALLSSQRQDGNFTGSWDPLGPWGKDGGRVYATAVAAITLQALNESSSLTPGR